MSWLCDHLKQHDARNTNSFCTTSEKLRSSPTRRSWYPWPVFLTETTRWFPKVKDWLTMLSSAAMRCTSLLPSLDLILNSFISPGLNDAILFLISLSGGKTSFCKRPNSIREASMALRFRVDLGPYFTIRASLVAALDSTFTNFACRMDWHACPTAPHGNKATRARENSMAKSAPPLAAAENALRTGMIAASCCAWAQNISESAACLDCMAQRCSSVATHRSCRTCALELWLLVVVVVAYFSHISLHHPLWEDTVLWHLDLQNNWNIFQHPRPRNQGNTQTNKTWPPAST